MSRDALTPMDKTDDAGALEWTKQELRQRIDAMDLRAAVRLLAMVDLESDCDDELTPEEIADIHEAEDDFKHGRTIRGEDLERELGLRR